jgi:hypothetical protein
MGNLKNVNTKNHQGVSEYLVIKKNEHIFGKRTISFVKVKNTKKRGSNQWKARIE